MEEKNIIFGKQAVLSAILGGRNLDKILFSKSAKGDVIQEIISHAKAKGIPFNFVPSQKLDEIVLKSQGIVAYAAAKEYISIEDLVTSLDITQNPILCILDEITDPHNVGAIARSAYAFGISGLIIPKHDSCGINSTVVKTSSGAIEFLKVSRVTNIVQTINYLKEKGFWIVATDKKGDNLRTFDFKKPIVIILGNEAEGVRKLVKENSDFVVSIPISKNFDSLNVSCAASIIFYETAKTKF